MTIPTLLDKISNSIHFPNLNFDEDLKFIVSSFFRFYGGSGVQMDYLEVSDTLSLKT
jgi:hypothetical protein